MRLLRFQRRKEDTKGMAFQTLIGIILLVAGFILVIGLIENLFSRAEGPAAEELCRTTNVFYAKGDPAKDIPLSLDIRLSPNACKSANIPDVPTRTYSQDTNGAMKNVAELMSRCWWMFLEGSDPELLGKRGFFGSDKKAKCIVCYQFTLQNGMGFPSDNLPKFLSDTPYYVQDSSDKCSTSGGFCRSSCDDPNGIFTTSQASAKCAQKAKGSTCCIATNECENKGGRCLDAGNTDFPQQYDLWACLEGKKCFVKRENFFTYVDYIQRTQGAGYIFMDSGIEQFSSGNQGYSIAYVSSIEEGLMKSSFKRMVDEYVVNLYEDYHLNGIMIGRKEAVEKYCFVQAGVGE